MKKLLTILLSIVSVYSFGQQVKFNQINPTLPANFQIINNGKKLGADSLYLGTPQAYASHSGKIYNAVGTSITNGTGAAPGYNKYASRVASLTGYTLNNLGRVSTTLGNPWASATSLVNNLSIIPTKGTNDVYLQFEYVVNDIIHGFSYSSVTYATDLQTCINYALSHGWSASNMVLTTSWYIDMANRSTMTIPQFQARVDSFNNAIRTVAATNSIPLVDWYKIQLTNGTTTGGTTFVTADGIHPNNTGHLMMARALVDNINGAVIEKGQPLEINGVTGSKTLQLSTYNMGVSTVVDTTFQLLTRDTANNIHSGLQLPPNVIATGKQYFGGQIIGLGSTTPTAIAPGTQDILMPQSGAVWGIFTGQPTYQAGIKLIDNLANMNFYTTYTGSGGGYNFNVKTSLLALNIANDQSVNITKNITVGYTYDISASQAGGKGSIDYMTNTPTVGALNLRATYTTSSINMFISGGSTGGSLNAFRMYQSGRSTFQNGGTFTDDGVNQLQVAGAIKYGIPTEKATATTAINATATVTAAQLATGVLTSTSVASVTMTLPTATLMATQLGAVQGTHFHFTIDNTAGANTVTIALGSGMTQLSTITGANTLTIPSGTAGAGVFDLYFSSTTACTISRIE